MSRTATEAEWLKMTHLPYRWSPGKILSAPRVQRLDAEVIAARETVCQKCEDFVGGFKRSQYRCHAKKTECNLLRITTSDEKCEKSLWPAMTFLTFNLQQFETLLMAP